MPQPKRSARPRLDAVVNHIKKGSYDDEIEQIKAAIDERNSMRRDAVMKLVKQVYGKDATVIENGVVESSISKPARRQRPGGPPAATEELPLELRAAEEAALAREAELEAEMAAQPADPSDEEAGIESRSPIIGSIT